VSKRVLRGVETDHHIRWWRLQPAEGRFASVVVRAGDGGWMSQAALLGILSQRYTRGNAGQDTRTPLKLAFHPPPITPVLPDGAKMEIFFFNLIDLLHDRTPNLPLSSSLVPYDNMTT
jgi:hypothetical protein